MSMHLEKACLQWACPETAKPAYEATPVAVLRPVLKNYSGMAWRITLILLVLLLGMYACAPSVLKKGAIAPEERQEYIENYGSTTSWEVRKAFVAGQIVPGMTKDLVVLIVGTPDRTAVENYGASWGGSSDSFTDQSDTQDSIWEYTHAKSGSVRFGLRFQGDTLRMIQGDLP